MPKNGPVVDFISAGCTASHPAHYVGEWPAGQVWVHEASDLWPDQPHGSLFRERKKQA